MRKVFSTASSLAAFVVFGLTARPASACCNDFWSCAGAFFSGGISCAVEAAQNEINGFVERVERTKREGQQQLASTNRVLEQESENACGSEDRGTNEGHARIETEVSSAAATIEARQKKESSAVEASLTAGLNKLRQIQNEAATTKTESTAKLREATAARQTKIQALNAAFQATFVAPLTALVAPLIAALDPVSAVATIAILADKLGEIQRETERAIARGVDEFEGTMRDFVQDLRSKREAQQKRADEAKALSEAIKALARAPSEANRQRLDTLVTGKTAPRVVTAAKLPFQLKSVALSKTNALPALKKSLSDDANFARKVKAKPLANFNKAAAEQSTRQGLDERLAGKTGTALEEERKKLLAEARARFKKDPKTLAAIEKGLTDEIEKRKTAKVKPAPTKPLPSPAPIRN